MITGRGGWPLTNVMTPDKKPFFAATYLPKETRYGMKGMLELIPEIKKLWENNEEELLKTASEISATLQKFTKNIEGQEITITTLEKTYNQLFNSFDEIYGGFGSQPKFPTPHNLIFLLRYWKRTGDKYSLKMVETTLEQMRLGGIYDHIGYGFHRYSTDNKWMLPHFEKMLYDQALLIIAYTEAHQATKKQIFKKTAEEIIEYVLRDMTSEQGGFYSAEDADSEGEEGKFYIWDYKELEQILTKQEFHFFKKLYNIKKEGNFVPEAEDKGKLNIFYQTMSLEEFTKYYGISDGELIDKLEKIRKKLFIIRKKRIHPDKDDKILTDWNGLMIAALAKAAQVFDNTNYIENAEKTLNFILKNMMQKNGELLHRYRIGDANISGYADDYAFLIFGLIELYQATFNSRYLQISLELNDYLIEHFWDTKNGGLFFTSNTNEELLTRNKEIYDGAIPSANSVSMYNFTRLAKITGNVDFEKKAMKLSKVFSDQINKMPSGYTQMMIGIDFAIGPSYEIVIVGDKANKKTQKIIQNINSIYLPNKVIILKEIKSKKQQIEKLIPFTKDYSQINNQSTIYICKNHQCQLPTTDIEKMKKFLE